jgi:hypothetical protein
LTAKNPAKDNEIELANRELMAAMTGQRKDHHYDFR